MFKKIFYIIFSILLIFFSISVFANDIEILSDIPGQGAKIKNHYKVSVHYRGFLDDGTEFDNSYKRNEPFLFQIGVRKVILGWEYGIMGMQKGGKRKIKIPPELGYGQKGAGDLIPPNSTLIFEVEIIDIIPPKYKVILSKDLNQLVSDENLIIIDIRTKKEWKKTGIIKGSKKITAFDSKGNFNNKFLNSFNSLIENKINEKTKIVFISDKGDVSSILANGFAEQLNFKNIFSLQGGIKAWSHLNYPLKK